MKKYIFGAIILLIISFIMINKAILGKKPSGERLKRIEQSPNYKDGQFQNLSPTPTLSEGYTMPKAIYEFLFEKGPNRTPLQNIPSIHTDLKQLAPDQDVLVWFGHSSYFIQIDGKKILVDPVLSNNASPIPNTTKAYKGADIYLADDIPAIDILFLSHDHYDHLDYETIKSIKDRVGLIVCGLGVGAHLEYWGVDPNKIKELDWYDHLDLGAGFEVDITPARHFSGRSLKRNVSLWVSFVFKTPTMRFFLGGDSGYDAHFKVIGEKYGPFDLAILENGQYDPKWRYIHTLPEELVSVVNDLKPTRFIPVHSSKFTLGNHTWKAPLQTAFKNFKDSPYKCLTPMIGEVVNLKNEQQTFTQWWELIE